MHVLSSGGGGAGYSLDLTEPQDHLIGDLSATAKTSYWFINYPTSGSGTLQVQIYVGNPAAGGVLQGTSTAYTVSSANADNAAAANKIVSVAFSPSSVLIGQSFNAIVCYSVNSTARLLVEPAISSSFDPNQLRLGAVVVDAYASSDCSGTATSTLFNQLLFTSVSSNSVRATYTFQSVGTGSVQLSPTVSARSGIYKYNSDFATPPAGVSYTVPSATNSVALAKNVNIAANSVGNITVTYTITATNSGSAAVVLDQIIDTLPSSPGTATYTANSVKVNGVAQTGFNPLISGQTLTWSSTGTGGTTFNVPASGGTLTLSFDATIPAANGVYTNSAIAKINATQIDTTLGTGDNVPATATTRIGPPVLLVTKTADLPNIVNTQAGTTSRYTIKVANSGTVATGVTLNDTALPTGFTYASTVAINTPTSASCTTAATRTSVVNPVVGATSPSWGNFTIPGGCEVSVQFDVAVASTVVAGTYHNSATTTTATAGATITNFDGTLAANTSDNVSVWTRPTVSKSFGPGTVGVGSTSVLTLTITNPNSVVLNGLSLTDTYPTNLFNTATPAGATTCTGGAVVAASNGGSVALSGGTVPANATCTVTVNVTSGVAGAYVNTSAGVGSTETGSAGAVSNAATLTVVGTQLSKVFGVASIPAGDVAALTFTITNGAGNPAQVGLSFMDTLPTGLTVSGTPVANQCGGTVISNGTSVTFSGGSLALTTASCTVAVNVTATSAGNYANTTSNISGLSAGLNATGLSASLLVLAPPTITKSFLTSPILASTGVSTLQIVLGNSNAVALTGATFTDTFPTTPGSMTVANLTTSNTCGGTLLSNLGTILLAGSAGVQLSGGTLPANGSCTVTINVKATLAGDYTNTIAALPGAGFLSTSNGGGNAVAASAMLSVRLAAPAVAKSFSPSSITAFTATTLTLTITNPSTAQAISGVAWSDVFPAGLKVFSVPNFSNTCGGTVTSGSTADDTSIVISNATVPFNVSGTASCSLSVSVTSTVVSNTPGMTNTTGVVSSSNAFTSATASATLIVNAPPLTPPSITKTFLQPSIGSGDISTIRFTLDSPNITILTDANFKDTLTNMSVASTALGGTCVGVTNSPLLVVGATGTDALNLTVPNLPPGGYTVEVQVTSTTLGVNPNSVSGVTTALTLFPGSASSPVDLTVVVKPTIAKAFAPASIANGAVSVLTFNLTNGNSSALTNVNFTDTLTNMNVASTAIGGTCAATSNSPALVVGVTGANALNFTVPSVPAGGCTVSVSITSTTAGALPNTSSGVTSSQSPTAGLASNTAVLTVAIGGVQLSGTVYNDANHNLQLDAGETGTGLVLYAKLVATGSSNALQAALVNSSSGTYQLGSVAAGSYVVLIDDNNALTDITPTLPTGWLGTEMTDVRRANVQVAASDLQNLNFGLYNGAKLSGLVFGDVGTGGGTSSNGARDGSEAGIGGVTVRVTGSSAATTYDSTVTAGDGSYTLWLPTAAVSAVLKVTEINPASYVSTGASVGNTGGSYDRTSDTVTLTNVTGSLFTDVNFGDVPVNRFAANGQQSGLPGNVLFYPHRFNAGSGGVLTVSTVSSAGWPHVLHLDLNCNGQIDAGDAVITNALTLAAGEQLCLVDKVSIPSGTALGAQDAATVQASFSYTNANPALTAAAFVIDNTTAGVGASGLVLTKTTDKTTASV